MRCLKIGAAVTTVVDLVESYDKLARKLPEFQYGQPKHNRPNLISLRMN